MGKMEGVKLTDKWMRERDVCEAAIQWVADHKTEDAMTLFQACVDEGHTPWVHWIIERFMTVDEFHDYLKVMMDIVMKEFEGVHALEKTSSARSDLNLVKAVDVKTQAEVRECFCCLSRRKKG
jgi:hypothetical protein